MARVLVAVIVAMVISIAVGPKFIEFLRRRELGQHIREEGPADHVGKQGTPVMGGLLIVIGATIPFLALTEFTLEAYGKKTLDELRATEEDDPRYWWR